MRLEQAVIFAGGRGERLRPLTDTLPKPMAPVKGEPFLNYLIQSLCAVGIKRVLLLVGYRHEAIVDYYRKHAGSRFTPDFSIGTADDLTGRRLLNAYTKLDDRFLLLYGDNYWPIELPGMLAHYEKTGAKVQSTVFRNAKGTGEYGAQNNVQVGPDGRILRYDRTRKDPSLNGTDIGYFVVDKSILDPELEGNISFEEHYLPRLIAGGALAGFFTDRQYHYITELKSLKAFEDYVTQDSIPSILSAKAVSRG
ncbi:MAG: NTP transferase domain-containing protein [Elusimicrobia bacterium]|nr:NTP transferase domain-containing protein [Elusimicrobiota bacterium]